MTTDSTVSRLLALIDHEIEMIVPALGRFAHWRRFLAVHFGAKTVTPPSTRTMICSRVISELLSPNISTHPR
jgi:hypothetical protein